MKGPEQNMPSSAANLDISSILCAGSDGNPVKTPRAHNAEFPLADIRVDPRENYRWGSKEAMDADLVRTQKDPSDGSMVCTYRMLVDSIRTLGVEEPVGLVPRKTGGGYRVVYGFTRVMAAKEVGLGVIPAYVYDASLPEEEAQLLQLRENSLSLKRAVNWVAEVEMYQRLVSYARTSLNGRKPADMPKDDDGRPLSAKVAACLSVGRALGVAPATMKNRNYTLQHIHPLVRALSEQGKFSYAVANEFTSGDAKVPYTGEFVTAVLDELRKGDAELDRVTPESVRAVMRKLKDSGDKPMYEGGQKPTTSCGQWSAGNRQSAGALRDLCVGMWSSQLAKSKMTLRSTKPEDWDVLRKTKIWHMVVGIGIGSADVAEPVIAVGDDTGRAELYHEETAWKYALSAMIQAVLLAELRMPAERLREWVNNYTYTKDGGKRCNRTEFHSAITTALDESNFRTPIHQVIVKAREELRIRLGV